MYISSIISHKDGICKGEKSTKQGLELSTFQSEGQGLGKLLHVGYQTVGLFYRVILREGDEIKVLSDKQLSDIFPICTQTVIGGDGKDHGTAIP